MKKSVRNKEVLRRKIWYAKPQRWIDASLHNETIRKTLAHKDREVAFSTRVRKALSLYDHQTTILRRIGVVRGYNTWLQLEQPVWKALIRIVHPKPETRDPKPETRST